MSTEKETAKENMIGDLNMKKTFICLLILCLAGLLLPAATAEETSPVGTWYAFDVYQYQTQVRMTLSDTSSYSGTLTVNEDGTFLLSETEDGETHDQTGTWKLTGDGMLRFELPGIGMETTYPSPFISISGNNTSIGFSRNKPGPLTEPVLELTEEFAYMFDGTWIPRYLLAEGMKMDASVLGFENTLYTIGNGTFTASVLSGGAEIPAKTYTCTFQGNGLSVNVTDNDGNLVSQINISLLQDASITIPGIIQGVTLLCYKKAE